MAGPVFGAASKSKTHDNTLSGKGETNHLHGYLLDDSSVIEWGEYL
jgi:hypothetical protein